MLQNNPFVHNFGEPPIRRPNRAPPAAAKDGPRVNDDIRNAQIQLIDQTGQNRGVVETVVAIKMAVDAGMDLVEISPAVSPPVCKIMDYGKYKYSAQKKAAEARKKQKIVEIKEIKLRPMIDDHDYDVKMRAMQRFFEEGDKVKITLRYRGREMAQAAGLDLVEIAPNSAPPVAKLLDYGKYKYQAQKKAAEARKKQHVVEIKEIKLRPMIDDHDYDVKMRSMKRFFEEGDKVKITLRFRGREMAHQELGYKLLERVKVDTGPFAKIESEPRFEGRQMVMMLAPR